MGTLRTSALRTMLSTTTTTLESTSSVSSAPLPTLPLTRRCDGVVSGNLVYNITSRGNPAYRNDESSDGIYLDGGTRILIEQNVIHNVDFGIELASEHKDRARSYI